MLIMQFIRTSVIIFTFFKLARLELSPNFENCRKMFFYQATVPTFQGLKDSRVQICQRLRNKYHYATDYDTTNRIPVYSAYMLSFNHCPKQKKDKDDWFLEAQLADMNDSNMVESDINYSTTSKYGIDQSVEKDYSESCYDKGHLNPQMFNCESFDSREATFTLTNIAPQIPSFNQGVWKDFETNLHKISKKYCNFENARRYFITGVLPGSTFVKSDERVKVPTDYWTAVCCDSSNAPVDLRSEGWSAAFIGSNVKESVINIYLIQHFLVNYSTKLFADYEDENKNIVENCLFNQTKTDIIINEFIDMDKKKRFIRGEMAEYNISENNNILPTPTENAEL